MSNRGKNPNSLKALREHGNKAGQRNKASVAFSRSLRELIVREGEKSLTLDGKKHRKVELMVRQLWAKAIAGEAWAVAYISDRVEGRVPFRDELTGANGGPIQTEDVGLTDTERMARLATLFERARQARDRQSTSRTESS